MSHRIHSFVVLVLALSGVDGCTRGNPEFESDDTTGATTAMEPSTGSAPTTGADGASSSSSGQADTEPTTADETTAGSCPQHPDASITIEVFEGASLIEPSPACDDVIVRPLGPIMANGKGELVHQGCNACKCQKGQESVVLSFAGTLTLPPELIDCGVLAVWAGLDPEGNCRWEGFAIAGSEIYTPDYLATNARILPTDPFFVVEVGLDPDELCDGATTCQEEPGPGRHRLTFASGPPVVAGATEDVTIAFVTELGYSVTNRMSSKDLECHEHVAWTARLTEG